MWPTGDVACYTNRIFLTSINSQQLAEAGTNVRMCHQCISTISCVIILLLCTRHKSSHAKLLMLHHMISCDICVLCVRWPPRAALMCLSHGSLTSTSCWPSCLGVFVGRAWTSRQVCHWFDKCPVYTYQLCSKQPASQILWFCPVATKYNLFI